MYNFQQSVSSSLRTARETAHLTQREMSERLGVSRSAYTYYETGHSLPDLNSFTEICRILGVSADSMLGLA